MRNGSFNQKPERRNVKPGGGGGLQLPGTFTGSTPSPSPSPASTSSTSSRTTVSSSSSSLTPASSFRSIVSKPALAHGSGTLLSTFGSGGNPRTKSVKASTLTTREPTRLERLERARSSPRASTLSGGGVEKDSGGGDRWKRLGLNRAVTREPSVSPSGSELEEAEEEVPRSKTPKPSWGRRGRDGSEDEEEEYEPRRSIPKRSTSPPTSSPPPQKATRRPPIVLPGILPTATKEGAAEGTSEEGKGTLFGSLWTKAASAWSGGAASEPHVVQEGGNESRRDSISSGLEPPESKIVPFEASTEGGESHAEFDRARTGSPTPLKQPMTKHNGPIPIKSRGHSRQSSSAEPLPPVEPITYHRPPPLHPRSTILHSVARGRNRHRDSYDWLESLDESPLDPFLFHRQASRMATKKARVKARPTPHHTVTAPAVMAGTGGYAIGRMAHQSNHGQMVPNSLFATTMPPPTAPVPSGFPSHPPFSQPPQPPPTFTPHPGPPPLPHQLSSGYTGHPVAPSAGVSRPVAAGAAVGAFGTSQPPSTNAIQSSTSGPPPSASSSSAPLPSITAAATGAPAPRPPLQTTSVSQPPTQPPSLPASLAGPPVAYSYAYPSAPAAPVYISPNALPIFPSPQAVAEASTDTNFKMAVAKKLFGTSLAATASSSSSNAAPSMAPAVPPSQQQVPASSTANTVPPTSQPSPSHTPKPTSSHPATSGTTSHTPPANSEPVNHGALPPMPIPQSITPAPISHPPSSFYGAHLAAVHQSPIPPSPIMYAPRVAGSPLNDVGGWVIPCAATFHPPSPLPTPGPVAPSPIPSVASPNPSTAPTAATPRPPSTELATVEESTDPDLPAYSMAPASSATPVSSIASPEEGSTSTSTSMLSVPSATALSIPLPPSPAPSPSLRSISPVPPPIPPLPRSISPVPTLPTFEATNLDDFLPTYDSTSNVTTKDLPDLPPSPIPSPASPPLPASSQSPAPQPPRSPSPSLPPIPSKSPSPSPAIPSSAPVPFLSVVRTPSLSLSTSEPSFDSNTEGSPTFDSAQIVLQPPTPIDPPQSTATSTPFDAPPIGEFIDQPDAAGQHFKDDVVEEDVQESSIEPPSLSLNFDPSSISLSLDLDFAPLLGSDSNDLLSSPLNATSSSSFNIDFGGGGESREKFEVESGVGEVERDDQGKLELPVLREENLGDDDDEEGESDEEDNMSDAFEATASFVSAFYETSLARAQIDPGHTGRTEKWLTSQGMKRDDAPTIAQHSRRGSLDATTNEAVEEKISSGIYRPRTAPPSAIPATSLPPSSYHSRLSTIPSLPTTPRYQPSQLYLSTIVKEETDEANGVASPIETNIGFDDPVSTLNRGRPVSSTFKSGVGNAMAGFDGNLSRSMETTKPLVSSNPAITSDTLETLNEVTTEQETNAQEIGNKAKGKDSSGYSDIFSGF